MGFLLAFAGLVIQSLAVPAQVRGASVRGEVSRWDAVAQIGLPFLMQQIAVIAVRGIHLYLIAFAELVIQPVAGPAQVSGAFVRDEVSRWRAAGPIDLVILVQQLP